MLGEIGAMPKLWMILDVPYLAHRADAAMAELEHDGESTAILFGLMRDLAVWQDMFRTDKFVFCFDARRNKRKVIYQPYKENRKLDVLNEEEREHRRRFYEQVDRLRDEDLYRLGFRNVFWADGYEADDVLASVVMFSLPEEDEAIVVTSDSDLWQVISPTVSIYEPRSGRRKTLQWFSKTYRLSPCQWADVKAIAGCSTDNVRGIDGVGEKSAVAFLAGTLPSKNKRYGLIVEGSERWRRNLRLVQLPFEGCPRYELREDRLSRARWRKMCERWGLRSLRGLYPGR